MNTQIGVRPRIVLNAIKVARPYDKVKRKYENVEYSPLRIDDLLQDLETTIGVKVCESSHKSVCFHLTVRTLDGETTYLSVRPGSFRRSDWGDGKSSAAEVTWDLLRAYGYRGYVLYRTQPEISYDIL
jgi:hypothetical protein